MQKCECKCWQCFNVGGIYFGCRLYSLQSIHCWYSFLPSSAFLISLCTISVISKPWNKQQTPVGLFVTNPCAPLQLASVNRPALGSFPDARWPQKLRSALMSVRTGGLAAVGLHWRHCLMGGRFWWAGPVDLCRWRVLTLWKECEGFGIEFRKFNIDIADKSYRREILFQYVPGYPGKFTCEILIVTSDPSMHGLLMIA